MERFYQEAKKKILLVDDHEIVREGVRRVLERDGYEITEAEGGARALGMLDRGYRPDLVLLDQVLDDERGTRVLEQIKARSAEIKVAIFTGHHERDGDLYISRRESLMAGAAEYLSKSMPIGELRLAVQEVLAGRPSVELLRHLRAIDIGSEYCQSLRDFIKPIEERILASPLTPQVIGVIGEPGSGKTITTWQIIKQLFWGGGAISHFAEQHGFILRADMVHWGDPFGIIPSKGEVPPGSEENRQQVKESAVVFGHAIQKAIRRYYQYPKEVLGTEEVDFKAIDRDAKVISIVSFDTIGISGIDLEDEQVELPRADRLIRDLVQHQGLFEGLDFELALAGISASADVRRKGRRDRELLLKAVTLAQRRRLLKRRGIVIHDPTPSNILEFETEGAKPAEIKQIEKEVDGVTFWLNSKEELRAPVKLNSPSDLSLNYPSGRERIVGKNVIPWFFRRWGVVPDRAIVLYNRDILKRVSVYRNFHEHYPVKELEPWLQGLFESAA